MSKQNGCNGVYPPGTVIEKQLSGGKCKFVITAYGYDKRLSGQPAIALDFSLESGIWGGGENKKGIGGFTVLTEEQYTPEKLRDFLTDWDVHQNLYAELQQLAKDYKEQRIAMGKQRFDEHKPHDVTHVIVAKMEDHNIPHLSYEGTPLTYIILGWSKNDKKNAAELREAAARFQPTLHLAAENKAQEHTGSPRHFLAAYEHSYPKVYKLDLGTWSNELYEAAADAGKFLVNQISPASFPQPIPQYKPRIAYNPQERCVELYFYFDLPRTSELELFNGGWKYDPDRYCYQAPFNTHTLTFAHTFVAPAIDPQAAE